MTTTETTKFLTGESRRMAKGWAGIFFIATAGAIGTVIAMDHAPIELFATAGVTFVLLGVCIVLLDLDAGELARAVPEATEEAPKRHPRHRHQFNLPNVMDTPTTVLNPDTGYRMTGGLIGVDAGGHRYGERKNS